MLFRVAFLIVGVLVAATVSAQQCELNTTEGYCTANNCPYRTHTAAANSTACHASQFCCASFADLDAVDVTNEAATVNATNTTPRYREPNCGFFESSDPNDHIRRVNKVREEYSADKPESYFELIQCCQDSGLEGFAVPPVLVTAVKVWVSSPLTGLLIFALTWCVRKPLQLIYGKDAFYTIYCVTMAFTDQWPGYSLATAGVMSLVFPDADVDGIGWWLARAAHPSFRGGRYNLVKGLGVWLSDQDEDVQERFANRLFRECPGLIPALGSALLQSKTFLLLRSNKAFMLAAVQRDGLALEAADDSLRSDREFVLAALQQNGTALHFANGALCKDKEVVLAAVEQNGHALEFAEEFRSDREVVLAAVQQEGWALLFADDTLRSDKEVIEAAVQQNSDVLAIVSDTLLSPPDMGAQYLCQEEQSHPEDAEEQQDPLPGQVPEDAPAGRHPSIATENKGDQAEESIVVLDDEMRRVMGGAMARAAQERRRRQREEKDASAAPTPSTVVIDDAMRRVMNASTARAALKRRLAASRDSQTVPTQAQPQSSPKVLDGEMRRMMSTATARATQERRRRQQEEQDASSTAQILTIMESRSKSKTKEMFNGLAKLTVDHQLSNVTLQNCTFPVFVFRQLIPPAPPAHLYLRGFIYFMSKLDVWLQLAFILLSFCALWVQLDDTIAGKDLSGWKRYQHFAAATVHSALLAATSVVLCSTAHLFPSLGLIQAATGIEGDVPPQWNTDQRFVHRTLSFRPKKGVRDVRHLLGYEAVFSLFEQALIPLFLVTAVAFSLTLLPVMVTHWVPGVIIGFPYVLALVLIYAGIFLLFRLILTKDTSFNRGSKKGRDLPAGVVFLVTVLHRGALTLFTILMFQCPVTWAILFYNDGDYYLGHGGANYGQLVADDMNQRSVICFYFRAYYSAAGGINAMLSLI